MRSRIDAVARLIPRAVKNDRNPKRQR